MHKTINYYLTASGSHKKTQVFYQPAFMSMNNIVISLFCLLCLLIIPISSLANSELAETCKDFRAVLEDIDVNDSKKDNVRFKKGLLWRVESPNGRTNYLFGTIHSQDPKVSEIHPKIRSALVKSKILLMETIPNEEADQSFLNAMYFKNKQRLKTLLEPVLLEELRIIIQDYGVKVEHTNFVKPWAAFSIIGRPIPTDAPNLETNLLKIAQQKLLEIKSIESMEEILSALEKLTMDDQVIILKDTICNHEQIIEDSNALVDLYFDRDLAGMVEFNNQAHYDEAVFKRFMQHILYNRNKKMLERIEEEFKAGDVFVAVGASHIADEKGLLNQLSIKSYTITQIY